MPRLLFLFFFAIALPSLLVQAAEKRYVVKKNDTLIAIARKHGISPSVLLRHNGLKEPNQILAGKILLIPNAEGPGKKPIPDPSLPKELDEIHIIPNKWKHIVLHHSATDAGTVKGMDRYHREERHMENGLAYHFVIGNGKGMIDGEITIGPRWFHQIKGGHLASESLNEQSIGICMVGNFDQQTPTRKQMDHLAALVAYLTRNCHLAASAVKTHQQINPVHTRCPGRKFPMKSFLKKLASKKS